MDLFFVLNYVGEAGSSGPLYATVAGDNMTRVVHMTPVVHMTRVVHRRQNCPECGEIA